MTPIGTPPTDPATGHLHDDHSHDDHSHGDHRHGDHHGTDDLGETYPHVRGGPAVLDIGGDIGAMVVTMKPAAAGTELHLRSAHAPPVLVHTGVWRRALGEQGTTSAVFAELREGSYWVLDAAGRDLITVEIRGGRLTSIDLSG